MVMGYGGGGPAVPSNNAANTGASAPATSGPTETNTGEVNITPQQQLMANTAVGQAIGTVDNPSLLPSVSLFSQQAYEEDGDSMLGSLLPNVHITKVTLEQSHNSIGLIDRDPHIVTGDYTTNTLAIIDAMDTTPDPLKVKVDLVIKEKIEEDDASLFTIENIVNALKVRVLYCYTQPVIDMVKTSGNTLNYVNPQQIGKIMTRQLFDNAFTGPTASSPFFPYFYDIQGGGYKNIDEWDFNFVDIPLMNIPQFQALTSVGFNNNQQEMTARALLSLDKEVLTDGTVVYKIPISVPHMIIPAKKGGTSLQSLTVFATSFIDFNKLIDMSHTGYNYGSNTLQAFVLDKKDQFDDSIGYNSHKQDLGATSEMAKDFSNFILDFGSGTASVKDVLVGGKIAKTKDVFIYTDTRPLYAGAYGKIWAGPVHYHGPNNKGPNNYVGYMGGTPEHMALASGKPTPKLSLTKMKCEGEVLDFRQSKIIEELILNYSDFGLDDTFKEFVSPTPPVSFKTGVEAIYEKQTRSNDWLKAKQKQIFSEPMFSLMRDGSCGFVLSVDMDKAVRYNTALPGFFQTLSVQDYIKVLGLLRISNIKIFRHEVSTESDNLGNPYLDESEQIPVLVVQASSQAGVVKGFSQTSDGEVTGLIDTINLHDNDPSNMFLKHFAVRDFTMKSEGNDRKRFQYSIEIEMSDPSVEYIRSLVDGVLTPAVNVIRNYHQFSVSKKSFYNLHTNTFTKTFHDALRADASIYKGTNNDNILQASQTNIIHNTVNNITGVVLPKLKKFSTQDLSDLNTYMQTLVSPIAGNPSGIMTVLRHLELFEKKILDLLDINSSMSGTKSSTYGEDTLGDKITAKGGTGVKNMFKLKRLLKGSFDNNSVAEKGYRYFGATTKTLLPILSVEAFLSRIELENNRFGLNDISRDLIPEQSVETQTTRFLAPETVNTVFGKTPTTASIIGSNPERNVDIFLKVLQTKLENPSGAAEAEFSVSEDDAEAPDFTLGNTRFKSLKSKVPNIMRVLQNSDVSIQNKSSNLPLIYKEGGTVSGPPATVAPPMAAVGLNNQLGSANSQSTNMVPSALEKIKPNQNDILAAGIQAKLSREYFPKSAKDPSQLLITLLASQALDVLSVDALSLLFFAISDQINELPNHIKKVYSEIITSFNNGTLDEFKKEYESFANAALLSLAHGNLVELEYFNGYTSQGISNIDIKNKKFKSLTSDAFADLRASNSDFALIRMKKYSGFNVVRNNDSVELPIYDEYFLIDLR